MNENLIELFSNWGGIVLGWVLGLGSAAVGTWWKDRRQCIATRRTIAIELTELSQRLMFIVWEIEGRRGTLDREALAWVRDQVQRYDGLNQMTGVPDTLIKLLGLSDEQLKVLAVDTAANSKMKLYGREEAPYTALAMATAHDFDSDVSRDLVDILFKLRQLNDQREEYLYYHHLTFDGGITPENHARAVVNTDTTAASMAAISCKIVDRIWTLRARLT
jgi:hypothetical protein